MNNSQTNTLITINVDGIEIQGIVHVWTTLELVVEILYPYQGIKDDLYVSTIAAQYRNFNTGDHGEIRSKEMLSHLYFICKTIESNIDILKSVVVEYTEQHEVIDNILKTKTTECFRAYKVELSDLEEFVSNPQVDESSLENLENNYKCCKEIMGFEYEYFDSKVLLFNTLIQPHISMNIIPSKIDQVIDFINNLG
jgi:hypothetical protein